MFCIFSFILSSYLVDMHSEGFSELQVFSYGIVVLAMTFLITLFFFFYLLFYIVVYRTSL